MANRWQRHADTRRQLGQPDTSRSARFAQAPTNVGTERILGHRRVETAKSLVRIPSAEQARWNRRTSILLMPGRTRHVPRMSDECSNERRWVVVAEDGRYVTLGRASDPSEEEILGAEKSLVAQGLCIRPPRAACFEG